MVSVAPRTIRSIVRARIASHQRSTVVDEQQTADEVRALLDRLDARLMFVERKLAAVREHPKLAVLLPELVDEVGRIRFRTMHICRWRQSPRVSCTPSTCSEVARVKRKVRRVGTPWSLIFRTCSRRIAQYRRLVRHASVDDGRSSRAARPVESDARLQKWQKGSAAQSVLLASSSTTTRSSASKSLVDADINDLPPPPAGERRFATGPQHLRRRRVRRRPAASTAVIRWPSRARKRRAEVEEMRHHVIPRLCDSRLIPMFPHVSLRASVGVMWQ